MAGNWIKIEHITPDKPEIVAIATALGIDQDAALGKCLRFWIWIDQQSFDGSDLFVTPSFIDRLTNCPGFSNCLLSVRWLKSRSDRIFVPNLDRHLSQTAKNRALTAVRNKRLRDGQSVRQSSPDQDQDQSPKVPLGSPPEWEAFRQAYPGTKRGREVEWEHFRSRHPKDAMAILPLLLPAAKRYAAKCADAGTEAKYIAHLKTWINQQRWTEEAPAAAPAEARPRQVEPDSNLSDWEREQGAARG